VCVHLYVCHGLAAFIRINIIPSLYEYYTILERVVLAKKTISGKQKPSLHQEKKQTTFLHRKAVSRVAFCFFSMGKTTVL